jgi:hypothetical protein
MLLTLRKLPVIGLSFVHIINSNMRDIHTERRKLDDLSLKSYLHTYLAQQVFLKCNATTLCCHLGQIRGEKRGGGRTTPDQIQIIY